MLRSLTLNKLFRSLIPSLFSAILLVLSFPKFDFWFLVWTGLIPLFFVLDGKTHKQAFWMSYVCGVFFFTGTVYWIAHVTVFGAILLILYLALYFGFFGLGYSFFSQYKSSIKLFLLPSLWVVLEFIRARALSGFGWASLGQSQYKNLWMIQIADITGMLGVSFLIVMVNVFLKEFFTKITRREYVLCTFLVCGILSIVLGYGIFRISMLNKASSPSMMVGIVQANIPQHMKWKETAWPEIINKHMVLTQEAAKEKPDLIIWPETAFPGFLLEDKKYFQQFQKLAKDMHVPILFGSVTKERGSYYNSAALLSSKGVLVQRYDKTHLVPFGEYIPFRAQIPFLTDIIPIADFSSGTERTIFSSLFSHDDRKTFSTLICFEDTIGQLARQFVKEGAGLLINITNDAWFKDTAAPFMHLQSAVFRTVENRRSLVRSANTGISGFIDATGNINNTIHNKKGKKTFISGYEIQKVSFGQSKTFYTKYGDVFAFMCFGCIIGTILINRKGRKNYEA